MPVTQHLFMILQCFSATLSKILGNRTNLWYFKDISERPNNSFYLWSTWTTRARKKKCVQCYSLTHDYQSQFFCMIWIRWKNPHAPNIMLLPTWSCIWVNIDSDFPGRSDGKESVCNAGDPGSIPGSGRFPGEGNGNPLQYSCLENSMGREAWWATVHGVPKIWTQLSD